MAKFIPNRGFEREMLRQAGYKQGANEVARIVAGNIRDVAPVDEGTYRDGIEAVEDAVEVRDWKWHLLEYGTVDTPIFAPVRRGVQNAGLKFKADR